MANIFDLFKQISSDSSQSSGNIEYIVVGLGNPGKEYDVTGYSTEPLISGVSSIDNITNIYDYLGIERLESNSSGFQEVEITSTNDSNSMEWLVWTSMIFLSIVLVFFSVKKIVKINK